VIQGTQRQILMLPTLPRSTRLTSDLDTPALAATSMMVGARPARRRAAVLRSAVGSATVELPGQARGPPVRPAVGGQLVGGEVVGQFLGEVINFLIVAFVLFVFIVKCLGGVMKFKKEEADTAAPPPTRDQELLAEIRDLLKKEQAHS